jgi:hypothetical protein
MICLKTPMYCKFGEKWRKRRKTVRRLRLFTTSLIRISQASQVDAESEGEGLQVPPLTRN